MPDPHRDVSRHVEHLEPLQRDVLVVLALAGGSYKVDDAHLVSVLDDAVTRGSLRAIEQNTPSRHRWLSSFSARSPFGIAGALRSALARRNPTDVLHAVLDVTQQARWERGDLVLIHLDPWWNPAVEDQAPDRAHRIGQTRPITIIRLVTEGTIEEKVLALHDRKRKLYEDVVSAADGAGTLDVELLVELPSDDARRTDPLVVGKRASM